MGLFVVLALAGGGVFSIVFFWFCLQQHLFTLQHFLKCSKNAPFWNRWKRALFPPPQTPFKTYGVVEGF
jgi:hypothetical protein